MNKGHYQLSYRPMPMQSRFGLLGWAFHHENCYTSNELKFREQLLTARAVSAIDQELLQTSDSWFADSNDIALINENPNSWFLNSEFRPRHELSLDDFHINLIDNHRLNWPELSVLMRNIGDYLLIRNSELSPDYFNQPMNYILLDIIQILKRLAMIKEPSYVSEQLQRLKNYLRTLEIHISPTLGSDRLFLADCRYTLETHVEAEITQFILNEQLRNRLYSVKQQLNNVAELRHTILHFALIKDPVNPHPYWEHFTNSNHRLPGKTSFPTLTAKSCATTTHELLDDVKLDSALVPLTLTEEMLANCPEFNFIDLISSTVKTAYGQSIADLQEIVRFQAILDNLLQVFEEVGEVFTLLQFREELQYLLQGIETFIHHSEQNILLVLDANTQAYHRYIQAKQDLNWWDSIIKKKQEEIDNFILNQDNLARFTTTPSDLKVANNQLIEQVNQVILHLAQHASSPKQLQMVSHTKTLLDNLMLSMQAWTKSQQNLPVTRPANQFSFSNPVSQVKNNLNQPKITRQDIASPLHTNLFFSPPQQLMPQKAANHFLPLASNTTQGFCLPKPSGSSLFNQASSPDLSQNDSSFLSWNVSLLLLLPASLFMTKIIYDKVCHSTNQSNNTLIKLAKFKLLLHKTADNLAIAQHETTNLASDWDIDIDFYIHTFCKLEAKLTPNQQDFNALNELNEDLSYLITSIHDEKNIYKHAMS